MNNRFDNLWIEKYRPSTINDIVLSEDNRDIVNKFFDNNEEPIMNYYYGVCEDYGYKNVFDMFAKNEGGTTMDEFKNWATWGILEAVAHEFYE